MEIAFQESVSVLAAQLYSRVKGIYRMGRAAGTSPNSRLSVLSSRITGAQHLIITWTAGGMSVELCQRSCMIKVSQASRPRDSIQIGQEGSSCCRGRPLYYAELREPSGHDEL